MFTTLSDHYIHYTIYRYGYIFPNFNTSTLSVSHITDVSVPILILLEILVSYLVHYLLLLLLSLQQNESMHNKRAVIFLGAH